MRTDLIRRVIVLILPDDAGVVCCGAVLESGSALGLGRVFVRLRGRKAQRVRYPTERVLKHTCRKRAVLPGNPGFSPLCSQSHALTRCVIWGGRRTPSGHTP